MAASTAAQRPTAGRRRSTAAVRRTTSGARQQQRPGVRVRQRLQSGFCVDGVCCNSACTETCKTCNVARRSRDLHVRPDRRRAEHVGRPAPSRRRVDLRPRRHAATAPGHCRKYVAGTVCKPGTCQGAPSATSTSATARAAAGRVPRRSARRSTAIPRRTSASSTCTSDTRLRQRRPVRRTAAAARSRSGAVCAKDSECASDVLRRRGLLQRRLQGAVRHLQPAGPRGDLLADRHRTSPIRTASAPSRRRRPAAPPAPATASAAARATRPRPSASRRRARATG